MRFCEAHMFESYPSILGSRRYEILPNGHLLILSYTNFLFYCPDVKLGIGSLLMLLLVLD